LSLLPWELAEVDRTSRVKKGLGKPRDSRIQILAWQKEKVTLGMCHLPSLITQLKMLWEHKGTADNSCFS